MAKKGVPPPKPPRRNMVPPVNVVRLLDSLQGQRGEAAGMVGASMTTLYKGANRGEINKVYEIAAGVALENLKKSVAGRIPEPESHHGIQFSRESEKQGESVAQEMTRPALPSTQSRSNEVSFFVTVPAEKVETFRRFTASLGAAVVSA